MYIVYIILNRQFTGLRLTLFSISISQFSITETMRTEHYVFSNVNLDSIYVGILRGNLR